MHRAGSRAGFDARSAMSSIGRRGRYRRTGIVFAIESKNAQAEYQRYHDQLQAFQVQTSLLSSKEIGEKYPDLDLPLHGALLTPDDGRAEPQLAGPAIALAARDRGANILVECAVRGLELSAGRVSGVVTERGTIACDAVVLAGGVWSNFFARRYGIDIPQLPPATCTLSAMVRFSTTSITSLCRRACSHS